MRLRSSQFVFLVLLVCIVQVPQEHALRFVSDAMSGSVARASSNSEAITAAILLPRRAGLAFRIPATLLTLDAAALSAHRTAWDMRRPALQAAAMVSYTSLLRA